MPRIIRTDLSEQQTSQLKQSNKAKIISRVKQEAMAEANKIIESAQKQKEQIILAATNKKHQIEEEIFQNATEKITNELLFAKQKAHEILTTAKKDLILLATQIAEKILKTQINLAPELVENIVDQCIEQADSNEQIKIRVNPQDLPIVQKALLKLQNTEDKPFITLCEDENITRGGCIIDTQTRQIDGQIESQLKTISLGLANNGK